MASAGAQISYLFLFLFPFSVTVLPVVHGVVFVLVVLLGSVIFFRHGSKSFEPSLDEKKINAAVFALVVIATFVTIVVHLDPQGFKHISKIFLLLMTVPAYYYFRSSQRSDMWFWYGLVAGSVLSAVIGIYEVTFDVYKPGYEGRAKGATHPIIFGDLALLMGFMSLAGLGWFKTQAKWQMTLPVLAVIAGLLASLLSQSRGGWIAIPFLVFILLWSLSKQITRVHKILGVVFLVSVLIAAYFVPQTGVQNKIQATLDNIQGYAYSGIGDNVRGSSLGSRFEMWQASWQIFLENPVLGVGWGNYRAHARELVEQGLRNHSAANWPHPHNQYLSSLVSGGILAFIATIMVFYVPARYFYKVIKSRNRSSEAEMIAVAGLLMVVGFAIFNLSESFLERSRTVTFFVFYLAVCMAAMRDPDKAVA